MNACNGMVVSMTELFDPDTETLDTMITDDLRIVQRKEGYRFTVEAVLLADFVTEYGTGRMLEIGTGCGVISIISAQYGRMDHITAIEIQQQLFRLAERNVALNGLVDRITLVEGDARDYRNLFSTGEFDAVVANPPYYGVGERRLPQDAEKRRARYELDLSMNDVVEICHYCLREGGRCFLVHDTARLGEIWNRMEAGHLFPVTMRPLYPDTASSASSVLIEGEKGKPGSLTILPPVYLDRVDVNGLFPGRL
jgi:tRNA1Val (adenine37-N6)-methyltransferase